MCDPRDASALREHFRVWLYFNMPNPHSPTLKGPKLVESRIWKPPARPTGGSVLIPATGAEFTGSKLVNGCSFIFALFYIESYKNDAWQNHLNPRAVTGWVSIPTSRRKRIAWEEA
jgi:hypothetical protein